MFIRTVYQKIKVEENVVVHVAVLVNINNKYSNKKAVKIITF